jgi:hypothetical protein
LGREHRQGSLAATHFDFADMFVQNFAVAKKGEISSFAFGAKDGG